MNINFNKRQRKEIRKFLTNFHGKERTDLYKIFKAVAYLVYTGIQWKMLPSYYPRPTTVYYHFRKWCESSAPVTFLRRLVAARRHKIGRRRSPTVAVIDSRCIRSANPQSTKGIDGFKKVKGIKCHILVDTNGFPLLNEITTANIHDSKGCDKLLADMQKYYPTVALVKADYGYRGIDCSAEKPILECVKSSFGSSEFVPVSGRWVVERTNAWLDNFRRLCRNYERYLNVASTMTYIACILFMLRYL